MTCPTCNAQNSATSVRCLQCGTILIHEAVGHSDDYKKGARYLDARMYSGIGAFAGFFAVGLFLKADFADLYLSDRDIYLYAVFGGIAGSIIGRLIARSKSRDF